MKYLQFIVIGALSFPLFGCSIWKNPAEKKKIEFKTEKTRLEREVELLRLERRKLMLEQSIDRMDSKDPTLGDKNFNS